MQPFYSEKVQFSEYKNKNSYIKNSKGNFYQKVHVFILKMMYVPTEKEYVFTNMQK